MNEKIEFNEYKDPAYWLKRRAIRAFWNHVAPVAIVIGMLLAFLGLGILEVNL